MKSATRVLLTALAVAAGPAFGDDKSGDWVPLFNGKDLSGWTPKITKYPLGENFADTFRVEDGLLKVKYDKYDQFDGKFGHLFYKDKFSHYVIRIEYRFVGEQCKGGPGWAIRNSGLMFHCQDPKTMRKEQEFPVSIEAQFLGGNGKDDRSTLNVCSPGTHIVMDGKLITRHCNPSKSKTFHGDQWVTAEVEVRGSGKVTHRVNGDTVLEYEQPQLDPGDRDAAGLIKDKKVLIEDGYLALQAESHPIEFRKVEIKVLKK
jgi:3-keto-disaccharide hydrolase